MKKPLHNTLPRLQRMLLSLQKYDIDLVYLADKENILADTLSCAHLEETTEEIAKEDNKDPYLAMLEERNTPVDNYKSPAELAFGRQLQSILPVSPNNLTVKSVDNNEFKQRRSDLKSKQKEYYDQHTKELKNLHSGENIRMFRNGKWKPATVVQRLSKPRSYIVKADNGHMYQRNRSKLMKTEINEDQTIEISDDDGEAEIINIKTEDESHVTNQEEQQENNTEVRTRSGRISRRPKRFEDYETF